MKINKIYIGGLAMLALSSCSDYLDVEPATNAATTTLVFEAESEVNKALNGVYAKVLADATFGNDLYNTFQLNSDVDFVANSNEAAAGNKPQRFDVRADASNVEKLWNNLYAGVEAANEFIYNLQQSELYNEGITYTSTSADDGTVQVTEAPTVTNVTQMMGEAKVMRAMFYHELLWYWGDIPFTLKATAESNDFTPQVTKRQAISDALIADLKHAAEYMKSDTELNEAPRRISKEAAYAMIARLALQAGGYSLNHDENDTRSYKMTRPDNYLDYYQIARDYAKKVIDAQGHKLKQSYRNVFINECNYNKVQGDDPIFEIPFVQNSTSCWGYAQGPSSDVNTDDANYLNSNWGKTNGGVRVSYFYRLSFDELDLRRDFINGMWYYSNKGLPTLRFDYAMHNNKWSKLWSDVQLGANSTSATGIPFAYIRYTDVLLMFAEADNELTATPSAEAKSALQEVRKRAFDQVDWADKVYDYTDVTDKDKFRNLVLDERKWEFAGENMRWKDLVRNNMYKEAIFYTFLRYYAVAENQIGSSPYLDQVNLHDFDHAVSYEQLCPTDIYAAYVVNYHDPNFPNDKLFMMYVGNAYGEAFSSSKQPRTYFKDNGLDDIYLAVTADSITAGTKIAKDSDVKWQKATITWGEDGTLKNQIYYSLWGYIRGDDRGNIRVVDAGATTNFNVNSDDSQAGIDDNISRLPDVRYLLPYPSEAIARSAGAYKNYYGY